MSVSKDALGDTTGTGVATAPGVARCAGVENDAVPAGIVCVMGVDGEWAAGAPPASGVRLDELFLSDVKSPISSEGNRVSSELLHAGVSLET